MSERLAERSEATSERGAFEADPAEVRNEALQALARGEPADAFAWLGPHRMADGRRRLFAFQVSKRMTSSMRRSRKRSAAPRPEARRTASALVSTPARMARLE